MYKNYITSFKVSQDDFARMGDSVASELVKRVSIHKGFNVQIVKNLSVMGYVKKALNIDQCGTFLEVYKDENNVERVSRANFCRERLCSVCAWRRQSRFIATTEPALRKIDAEVKGKTSYIFVTLTTKNVYGGKLSEAITSLLSAWNKLLKRRTFGKYVLGYIRNIEVTYNREKNTYHPHLHALLLMSNTYFNGNNYLSQEKWAALWKYCLDVDYTPVVHVQAVKEKSSEENYAVSASLEVMKYSLKTTDFAISPKVTETLMEALKGRRLISFGGLIAKARKELKYAEIEEDNLVDDITAETISARKVLYLFTPSGWKIQN